MKKFALVAASAMLVTTVAFATSARPAYAANKVVPHPWDAVVSLAVLSSLIAVVQAQLNAWSRVAFGMTRKGILPSWFSKFGQSQTPEV